jgi:hypothetical protein
MEQSEIDALARERFAPGKTPRSEAFKAGWVAGIKWKLYGVQVEFPYVVGTPQADAYFAGVDDGMLTARFLKPIRSTHSGDIDA